jgi:hypothetical protein
MHITNWPGWIKSASNPAAAEADAGGSITGEAVGPAVGEAVGIAEGDGAGAPVEHAPISTAAAVPMRVRSARRTITAF